MIYDEQLKEWYYGPIDSRSSLKETLMYMNEMYKNNLFDPEQETHNVEQYLATAQKGLWGFTFMYVNMTRAGADAEGGDRLPDRPHVRAQGTAGDRVSRGDHRV